MLRSRDPAPALPSQRAADPLGSLTVTLLWLIALALFAAAILAVYTYSTPGVEVPLVIAIALSFGVVLALNVLGRGLRRWLAGR